MILRGSFIGQHSIGIYQLHRTAIHAVKVGSVFSVDLDSLNIVYVAF